MTKHSKPALLLIAAFFLHVFAFGQTVTVNGSQVINASSSGNFDFVNGSTSNFFFRWMQNGSTPMTLSTNNNLLIGTTTDVPAYKLNVNGTSWMQQGMYIGSPTAVTPFISINSTNSANLSLATGGSPDVAFNIYASGAGIGQNYAMLENGKEALLFDTRSGIAPFRFNYLSTNTDWLDIYSSGNVGIGTTYSADPGYKLGVNGSLMATAFTLPTGAAAGKVLTSDASGNATWQTASGSGSGWSLGGNTVGTVKALGTVDNNDFPLVSDNLERMRITAGGNVLIGKTSQTNATYLLDVNGNIRSNKVVVNTSGADFVFEPTYGLPGLSEVEAYIQAHRHLPGIASAADMEKDGVDVGKIQIGLLQKIEEMTLYLIGQNKQIDQLTKDKEEQQLLIKALQEKTKKIDELEAQINEIKALLKKS